MLKTGIHHTGYGFFLLQLQELVLLLFIGKRCGWRCLPLGGPDLET